MKLEDACRLVGIIGGLSTFMGISVFAWYCAANEIAIPFASAGALATLVLSLAFGVLLITLLGAAAYSVVWLAMAFSCWQTFTARRRPAKSRADAVSRLFSSKAFVSCRRVLRKCLDCPEGREERAFDRRRLLLIEFNGPVFLISLITGPILFTFADVLSRENENISTYLFFLSLLLLGAVALYVTIALWRFLREDPRRAKAANAEELDTARVAAGLGVVLLAMIFISGVPSVTATLTFEMLNLRSARSDIVLLDGSAKTVLETLAAARSIPLELRKVEAMWVLENGLVLLNSFGSTTYVRVDAAGAAATFAVGSGGVHIVRNL